MAPRFALRSRAARLYLPANGRAEDARPAGHPDVLLYCTLAGALRDVEYLGLDATDWRPVKVNDPHPWSQIAYAA